MAKQKDAGVYQLKNGNWSFRYTITRDGTRKDVRKAKDEEGQPLLTKKSAIAARNRAIEQEKTNPQKPSIVRKTVNEVWREYCEKGRTGKAYTTIRKQDSLWENHIGGRFGKRFIFSPFRRNAAFQLLF